MSSSHRSALFFKPWNRTRHDLDQQADPTWREADTDFDRGHAADACRPANGRRTPLPSAVRWWMAWHHR